jgi:predicted double-glycine peptidase
MKVPAPTALLGLVAVVTWSGCSAQAKGGVVAIPGGGLVWAPVRSLVELRFTNVVRQSYDLSCGAAALATILNHYYGDEVSERTIIDSMLEIGTKEKILKDGFSLLELKRFAEKEGYVSAGYRLEKVDDLVKVKVPSIALVNVRGYAHFVVIKGVVGGQVYVADPAFGNRARSLKSFAQEWNQVILVVLSPTRSGNAAFIEDGTLRSRPGEVMLLLDRALHSISPQFGEFGLR